MGDQAKAPAIEQAYDALLAFVEAAPDGSQLPSERGLAVRLGVSRTTLRTAVDRLVRLGLLKVKHGSGTVVRKPGGATLALPFRELIDRLPYDRTELFELRRIVEPRLAGLAARRRSEGQANAITAVADAGGPEFHIAVATAAKNAYATELVTLLATALALGSADEAGKEGAELQRQQRISVAAAIRARDSRSAREAMATHLRTATRVKPGGP